MASVTRASRRVSANAFSQPLSTSPVPGCPAVHCTGSEPEVACTSLCRSSEDGGGASAQDTSVTSPSSGTPFSMISPRGLRSVMSMQLEHEPVHVGADAQDDPTYDLNVMAMLRVDRAMSDG